MTALILVEEQSELAKLIEQREELAGKLTLLRKRLKNLYPHPDPADVIKAREVQRKEWVKHIKNDQLHRVELEAIEAERLHLMELATFKDNKERLEASSYGYHSHQSQLDAVDKSIGYYQTLLNAPEPEIEPDPRIEITNQFAACEQRLAVVRAEIKVLVP